MKRKLFTFPRETCLKIELSSPRRQNARLDYKKGVLRIYDENGQVMSPDQIEIIRSRKRSNKKNKIISRVGNSNIMSLDIERCISDFDEIFAVDNNTKKIDNVYYSIGILAKLVEVEKAKTYRIEISRIISSENDTFKPEMEQAVWNKAIEEIEKMDIGNRKVGLIVDCDLGNIEIYNKREKKIRNDKFLPANFTLLYATADTKDNILNRMICFCDKEATYYLEQARKG